MVGMFAFTVDCVDIATGWTEQRAVWGKGETGVLEQIQHIEQSLPFSLLGFDSDNGSEFLNYHLLRHFTKEKSPSNSPAAAPIIKTIMPTSNKKTGPMSASGWDMTAWTTPGLFPS